MLNYVLHSIKRRRAANLVTVGISIMLVILLNLYFGSIRSYQKQLEDLAQSVPIYCQVTNINGTLGNGLFISDQTVDGLEQSDHVKELSCLAFLMAGEGDFDPADYARHLNLYVAGASNAESVGELTNDMINIDTESIDEFFTSDRMECIVSENMLMKRGWEIGGRIVLKCYYYDAKSEFSKLELHPMKGVVDVKIVGSMEDIMGKTNAIGTDIIIPFKAVKKIYQQFEIPFFADTITFYVKDPLNLNAFKEDMKNIGFAETIPDAADSYIGSALKIRDADFINSATDMRRSMELMQSFFPAVCALVLLIGYVVSYLSGNSRRGEYALLRLQGVKKVSGSMLFLLEQMILVLIGNFAGDAVIALVSPSFSTMAAVNSVILAAYVIGAAAAYVRMSRGSVVYLLSTQQ